MNDEDLNGLFGEMLNAQMHELRKDGKHTKLPLRPDGFLVVEEFDGRYFWPLLATPAKRVAHDKLEPVFVDVIEVGA